MKLYVPINGSAIKVARKMRGLTQRQLNKLIGISGPYLCKIEMLIAKNVSLEIINKFADILSLDISAITYGWDDRGLLCNIYEKCEVLSNSDRQRVLDFIDFIYNHVLKER